MTLLDWLPITKEELFFKKYRKINFYVYFCGVIIYRHGTKPVFGTS